MSRPSRLACALYRREAAFCGTKKPVERNLRFRRTFPSLECNGMTRLVQRMNRRAPRYFSWYVEKVATTTLPLVEDA